MKCFIFFLLIIHHSIVLGASSKGLDVNDASFLFPMNESGLLPKIDLSEENLITEQHLHDVLFFETQSGEISTLPYTDIRYMTKLTNWRVTSFRVDPCGENFELRPGTQLIAERIEGCVPRLRVVAQPLNLFGQPLATALHLIYDMGELGLQEIGKKIVELKRKSESRGSTTTGLPLMVHPILKAELGQTEKPFASELKGILLASVQQAKLSMITLSVRAGVNHWKFVAGIIQQGTWKKISTAFSSEFYDQGDSQFGVEDLACDEVSVCSFKPVSMNTSETAGATILNEIFRPERQIEQVPGHRSPDLKRKAELIDNPESVHFFNTNCVSCHVSSSLRDRAEILSEPFLREGVTPFVPRRFTSDKVNSVINFGYFGTIPRISTRTAGDAVAATDILNRKLGLTNPAERQVNPQELWNCLLNERDFNICLNR